MLEIKNASFSYADRKVVSGVSLSVADGELVAFLGANGAGKSTLLKLASGYLRPKAGKILLNGEDVAQASPAALARRRAVLEQDCALSFDYSVLETVKLGGYSLFGNGESYLSDASKSALREVGLEGFENRRYSELSGGEKRRVQLARALCQLGSNRRSKALLLDEPSAGLDPAHAHAAMAAARMAADDGASVVAVLHDPNLASSYADKIALLKGGLLAGFGRPEDVIAEDTLSAVYGAKCRIISDAGRRVVYFPKKID